MIDLGSMTDKFSETGQKLVRRAIGISKSHDHNFLSVLHIFAALSDVDSVLFVETMQAVGIDPHSVTRLLEEELAKSPIHVGRKMAIPEPTRDLFNNALRRARSQGRQQIESSDLFAALFTDPNGTPADILRSLGVDPSSGADTISKRVRAHEEQIKIFISYRRQDSDDVTGQIYDRLVQHFGRGVIFKDEDSIPLGADFRKFLGDAVGRCDLLLAVIGRQWLSSQNESGARRLDDPRDFVRIEIEAALQRGIPVIPLLVQGATVPSENDLPPSVQALFYRKEISIRPDPDFHHDVDRLIKGIELHFKNNS